MKQVSLDEFLDFISEIRYYKVYNDKKNKTSFYNLLTHGLLAEAINGNEFYIKE